MGHWTKFFYDGSKYIGEDKEIACGRASWRRSLNEGIIGVELHEGDVSLRINGVGEFWQSDLISSAFLGGSEIIRRSIQKKIENRDAFVCVEGDNQQLSLKVYTTPPTCKKGEMFPIQGYMIGKWLTLTYDIERGSVNYSFLDNKL